MSSPDDRRFEEAITWHARLALPAADEAAFVDFAAWLESDPGNRAAYDELEDFDGALTRAILRERQGDSRQSPISLQLRRSRRSSVDGWLVGAVAFAAALLVVFLVNTDTNSLSVARYATAVGRTRTIRLSDGSKIEMNTATALSVIGSDARRVKLERGEAVFRVRHEQNRRFIVQAGDREVRDVGTVFDVLRDAGAVTVAVAEGQIAVGPAGGGEPTRLHAGERLRHTEGSSSSDVDRVDPRWVAAWQSGFLVYRNAPLQQVVADLNRYFREPIVIDGSTASSQRFSGVLHIHDEHTTLTQLTAFLPLVMVRDAGGNIRLQAARPKH
jgi:transmembrane sensor